MDLRMKTKKIRDLVVYEFSALPKDIIVSRTDITIVFDKDLVDELSLDNDKVKKFLESMLNRQVVIVID